jgi:general secretion pathway protein G
MRLSHTTRAGRTGFTLVEVLVVIAIIAVLVSLISAAVFKALGRANETRTRTEISQLAAAVEAFKLKFGTYPPSRIKLSETGNYPAAGVAGSLDSDSLQTLQKIWPRIAAPVDWNGNGVIQQPNQGGDVVLEGDQCLVFFLAGIPAKPGEPAAGTGFSTNPRNPAFHVLQGGDISPPLFEFRSERLQARPGSSFYSYFDPYLKQPYAYFSSYKGNGYNRFFKELKLSDCSALGVWPYAQMLPSQLNFAATPRYQNPNTFQIISAGADGRFGGGTKLIGLHPQSGIPIADPSTFWDAVHVHPEGTPGHDDHGSFHDSQLGVDR